MNLRQALKDYICAELLDDEGPIEDDESLLVDGMVDSLGMLRLVGFIEESWGIKVPPEDFVIENFRNINALDAYLARAGTGPDGGG